MSRFMDWLRDERNRAILSWIGGGIVVVAGGLWTATTFLVDHKAETKAPAPTTSVTVGTGIASGHDTTIHGPVTIGPTAKDITEAQKEAQKPLAEGLEKLAAQVAREKGVEVAPLRTILAKLGEAGVKDEDIPRRLEAKADELIKLRVEIDKLRQGPPELAGFAKEAQALIDTGALDAAREVLKQGREAARKRRTDAARYEADFLAQEAGVDALQIAYRSAAAKYAEAAALVAPFDTHRQWELLERQADELYKQGGELGDDDALYDSIETHQHADALVARAVKPLDWAMTQNNLGIALWTLGEREPGTGRLGAAVLAFRAALEEYSRDRVPLDWAKTQMNLGNALWSLGERESLGDPETGTARLEEAVTAYRAALEEYTRDRVPLDWAMNQNNLGAALTRLGERHRAARGGRPCLSRRPRGTNPRPRTARLGHDPE